MTSKKIIEVVLESSEVALDQLIENQFLKDFPVVGTALKLINATKSIRDRIFAAKIFRFIQKVNSVSETEKQELLSKALKNADEAKKIGEVILLTLEKISDTDKCDLIAYLFVSYISSKLSNEDFRRFCEIVDKVFTDDLFRFVGKDDIPGRYFGKYTLSRLSGTTLVELKSSAKLDASDKIDFKLSTDGKKFIKAVKLGRKMVES